MSRQEVQNPHFLSGDLEGGPGLRWLSLSLWSPNLLSLMISGDLRWSGDLVDIIPVCLCMNSVQTCHSVTFYFMKKRLQTMLWHGNTKVNSHQRWKQTRFRVCFYLWCELTSTMNVTEWQVSWSLCRVLFGSQYATSWDFIVRRAS